MTYRLHREAKWHDGQRVTGDDVIFSFDWGPGSGDDLKIDGRQAQIGEQELDTRDIDRIDRATPPSSDRSSVHVPLGF